ncbi:hypothetical protein WR25_11687 isoform A [Diploscapter pachys]|uniref:Uncharacterized protein n=2 Tax=Diploscapter pachys TaxID=2018661 RepID=A0A2A2KP76_9BILA|nr:hypothetical protein WR25_11687 isoform A [Diploscapter pachys]
MRPSRDRVASRLDFTRRGLANQSNQSRARFLNRIKSQTMSSSSDNKVNMALDDIIKLNKKSATANRKPAGVRGKQGRGGRTVVGGRRFVGGANRKPAAGGAVRTRMLQRKVGGAAMNKQATKKLVQSLVKKALKRSTMRGQVAAAPGGLKKRGAVVRDHYIRTNPLNRVLARSRAIRGAVARPAATTVIQQIVPARRMQRGRGFQRNFQRNIVQEIVRRQPVQIVHQQQRQTRPVPIRRVVVQRQAQPRVIERITAPVIQRRVVPQFRRVQTVPRRQQQQQVVVVRRQAAPIQRVQQRTIQRNRTQPMVFTQPRRFQRQNNNNFGGGQGNRREFVQKNNRFRSALGLGNGGGRFIQEVQRFEPSSSFITSRRTARRGRGFRD